ncbi:MAG: FAD-binding oxidoreductase [Deltaproteobacteria bacterium]|nr:FAD-binding oxidoreductase [Deltaproteobacteria bacterium]
MDDVIIVGSGITGLTTALHLSKRFKKITIIASSRGGSSY